MKRIMTQGLYCIEPLDGSREWYWGMDYANGDLYEAEELFKQGHPVSQNKLLFIHYPDGEVVQPVIAEKGQYLGCPICYNNQIILLKIDFPAEKIEIIQFDTTLKCRTVLAVLALSRVEDCYNLMLKGSPLMLTRRDRIINFKFFGRGVQNSIREIQRLFCWELAINCTSPHGMKIRDTGKKRLCEIRLQEK